MHFCDHGYMHLVNLFVVRRLLSAFSLFEWRICISHFHLVQRLLHPKFQISRTLSYNRRFYDIFDLFLSHASTVFAICYHPLALLVYLLSFSLFLIVLQDDDSVRTNAQNLWTSSLLYIMCMPRLRWIYVDLLLDGRLNLLIPKKWIEKTSAYSSIDKRFFAHIYIRTRVLRLWLYNASTIHTYILLYSSRLSVE